MASYDLSGQGIQTLSPATKDLVVLVTNSGSRVSNGAAFPPNLYHVGLLRALVSGAAYPAFPIDATVMYVALPPNTDSIGYSLQQGSTIRVTEA